MAQYAVSCSKLNLGTKMSPFRYHQIQEGRMKSIYPDPRRTLPRCKRSMLSKYFAIGQELCFAASSVHYGCICGKEIVYCGLQYDL